MASEFHWSKSAVDDCTIGEVNYLLKKIGEKNKQINEAHQAGGARKGRHSPSESMGYLRHKFG